jgi:hypothetical protein
LDSLLPEGDFRLYAVCSRQDLTLQERLAGLSPEQRLDGLAPDEIQRYLRLRKEQKTAPKRKKKK